MSVKKMSPSSSFNFSLLKKGSPVSAANCARIHFRRLPNNFFFTLTDLNNRVVASLSLGQVAPSRNKRIKISPISFERIFLRLRQLLQKYSIKQVSLLMRSHFSWQLRNLTRFFRAVGIHILAIENKRRAGHGFLRAPKKPRK